MGVQQPRIIFIMQKEICLISDDQEIDLVSKKLENNLRKLLAELLETERTYVQDLEEVTELTL